MITTRTTLVVVLSLLAGCQRSSSTEPQGDAKESRSGATSAEAAVAPSPGPKATTPADAPVTLTPRPDGTIRLQYTDRWGAAFDATYESAEFLKRALPTLKRSLSEPRFAELEQASERLDRGSVR